MSRVTAISGLGGKAPACFLVETHGARFLLDLGEGPGPGQFPDLSEVGPVDAILISHGHADHIGGLHLASEVGNPPVFATAMTRAFAGHSALARAFDLPPTGEIEICGVPVQTGRAGHAAGGLWMRIGGEEGVLYTGDICRESLLYPLDTPSRAHTLIVDASYGQYDEDIGSAIGSLVEEAKIGPLLLPLPPTGRGVEIAVLLNEAGLPVSICAQHRRAASLMMDAAEGTLVAGGRERLGAMLTAAATVTEDVTPNGAMIAANGGATGGVARSLLARFVIWPGVGIVMTGHVEAGTEAAVALAGGRARFIRWNVHPRHRDLKWLHQVVRPQSTLYAFCDESVAQGLGKSVG